MGDRKLVSIFPEARSPSYASDTWLGAQLKGYMQEGGAQPDKSFFNMEEYSNPIGIEIEAESFAGVAKNLWFWRIEEDNSLKKNGVEFISYPLTRGYIDYALAEAAGVCQKLSFGHRTSVHVHCNVGHYTENQLCALMAAYALLERLFFQLVDFNRFGNSFCYPLVGTEPVVKWYSGHDGDYEATTKYCAFNIAPVRDQLSVEFRHMHGNCDPKTLRRWIQLCAKLVYYYGNQPSKTVLDALVTQVATGKFGETVREIWGDTTEIFAERTIQQSIKSGELWAMTLLTRG